MKGIWRFFSVFLFIMFVLGISSIAEEITLTTYYPAPYGAYEELTVAGNVGIGTTEPSARLDIRQDEAGSTGLYLIHSSTSGNNYGAIVSTTGSGASINYGICAMAGNAGNANYAIYVPSGYPAAGVNNYQLYLGSDAKSYFGGFVGIGTNPSYALDVDGDINTTGDVRKSGVAYPPPDYVFDPSYELMPIAQLREYVLDSRHLPNMPSKDEVAQEGVKIFEQNRILLEKLEEAYLYIFQLEERVSKLEKELR